MEPSRKINRSREKAQRWLDLLAALSGAGSRPLTTDTLMNAVEGYAVRWRTGDPKDREAARRSFERDKKELRELGIPIAMDRAPVGLQGEEIEAYHLPEGDLFLPYLRLLQGDPSSAGLPPGLDPDDPALSPREMRLALRLARPPSPRGTVDLTREEAALASEALNLVAELPGFPLASEARSALRKLPFDRDLPDSAAPVLFVERPGTASEAATVRALAAALHDRRRVQFRYRGIHRNEVSQRVIHPWGLLLQWGFWYLVGWDEEKEGRRVFRVGRIERCRTVGSGASGEYTIPPGFRLKDHLDAAPWTLGGEDDVPVEVVVHFHFPRSAWARRNGHGRGAGEDAEGGELRTFQVVQIDSFLRWILTLEGDAHIVSPPEVRSALSGLVGAVLARYGEEKE